jgi:hypothetical protein
MGCVVVVCALEKGWPSIVWAKRVRERRKVERFLYKSRMFFFSEYMLKVAVISWR